MKKIKRLTIILLTACLMASGVPAAVQAAADVRIFFSDLNTKVGDKFTITGTIKHRTGTLGDVEVEMSYDAEAIQFMSGDTGVEETEEGKIKYTGTGNSDTITFKMEFQALKEGTTKMTQDKETLKSSDGQTLTCEQGYSEVKIGAGDPSKIETKEATGISVTVEGQEYKISDAFNEAEIPSGFTASEMTYEGQTVKAAKQESSGLSLLYLIDTQKEGKFFIYDETNGEFSPFVQMIISETTTIILLQDDGSFTLPKNYEKVSLTVNEHEFPAWQDTDSDGYYVVYALNSNGEKMLYRYDSQEETYQRYSKPEAAKQEDKKKIDSSLKAKILNYVKEHPTYIILGAGLAILLLFVLLIIIAVKLHNRNAELDDLYEEYNIDGDNPGDNLMKKELPEKKTRFKKSQPKEEFFDDEEEPFEDFDDSSLLENDIDDFLDFDDEDTAEAPKPAKAKPSEAKKQSKPRKKKSKDDDDFSINFIDLE